MNQEIATALAIFGVVGAAAGLIILCVVGAIIFSRRSRPPTPTRVVRPASSRGSSRQTPSASTTSSFEDEATRRTREFMHHRDATPQTAHLLAVSSLICEGRGPGSGVRVPEISRSDPPPGRTITSAGGFSVGTYTPSGEIYPGIGPSIGRVDSATGDVYTARGHKIGNVGKTSNPDQAATKAQSMLDDYLD